MLLWPKKWQARVPSSLAAIVLTLAVAVLKWQVAIVGDIPRTLLPQDRLCSAQIPWDSMGDLIAPALTIAVLGMVESLLCGAVAGNMTGIRLHADQELVAQGVGNILIPFLGGVPATAAIARTSVGIKSRRADTGRQHRACARRCWPPCSLLAPVMSRIPLAALSGVLIVTAWRMNEWEAIRFMFQQALQGRHHGLPHYDGLHRFAGSDEKPSWWASWCPPCCFSTSISELDVKVQEVDPERLQAKRAS